MKKSSVSIYDFVNHKTFLKTVYEDLKFHNPGVSYKTIQEAAGYSGKSNHLWQILEGLTPINNSSIANYGKALLLTSREIKYFKLMVAFDKAKNDKERDAIIRQMKNSKLFSRAHHDYVNLYEIYDKWYLPVLWDMVLLDGFQEDSKWIIDKFFGDITASEVKKGIELLLDAKALFRDESGKLQQTSPHSLDLSDTKKEREKFLRVVIRKHILSVLTLLPEAIEQQPFDKRVFYNSTLVLAKEDVEIIKQKIFAFAQEITDSKSAGAMKDEIYQLNIQFFSHTSFDN